MTNPCPVHYVQKTKTEVRMQAEIPEGTPLVVRLHGENRTLKGILKYITVDFQTYPYLLPDRESEGIMITPVDTCYLGKKET